VAFRDITKTCDLMFQLLFSCFEFCILAWTGAVHRSLGSIHTSSFSFYVLTRLTPKFHIFSASLQQIMILAGPFYSSNVKTSSLPSSEPIKKWIQSLWHHLNIFKSEYILSDIIWNYSKVNIFSLISSEPIQKWIQPLWHHVNLFKSEYILSDIIWIYSNVIHFLLHHLNLFKSEYILSDIWIY